MIKNEKKIKKLKEIEVYVINKIRNLPVTLHFPSVKSVKNPIRGGVSGNSGYTLVRKKKLNKKFGGLAINLDQRDNMVSVVSDQIIGFFFDIFAVLNL